MVAAVVSRRYGTCAVATSYRQIASAGIVAWQSHLETKNEFRIASWTTAKRPSALGWIGIGSRKFDQDPPWFDETSSCCFGPTITSR